MDMSSGLAVDQEAEQLGSAVVTARVHQLFALVDQREVEVGDDFAFTRANRLSKQAAVRSHNHGEAPPEI
jgi:hypothetical protein